MQISKDLQDYGQYLEGLNVVPVYGGAPIGQQISRIKRGAQIIVATPGRFNDPGLFAGSGSIDRESVCERL